MSLFDLSKKTVLITGATKGIGRGIAERMAEHGAKLIVSSRDQSACDSLASELNERYGTEGDIAQGITCDLNQLDEVENLATKAIDAWDGVDVLVCNAAILPFMGPSTDRYPTRTIRALTHE